MEYRLLIIKNRYTKKLNLKTGLDWFSEHTPLKIVVDEISTDFDFTFKQVGNDTFKGTVPKDYSKLTEVVPRSKYHAVVLMIGNEVPGVRVSICEHIPLYPETEFIYLAKDGDGGKTLNHELFHAFFKALSRKGVYLNDPIDTYLNDSNLNAKVSNRTMALDLLKPHWERIVKPNSIIQNIVATVTTKPTYKYFKDNEVIGLKPELISMIDKARGIAGVPFKINSGFRTPEQNKKAGGVKDSSHMSGKAVDIACTSDSNRYKIVTALLTVGFNRIGIAKTFIHADCDSTKSSNVIWLYD